MKINWNQEENFKHKASKPNKNVFCKRNKLDNGKYGYHVYESNSVYCKFCRHVDKRSMNTKYNTENNTNYDEQ